VRLHLAKIRASHFPIFAGEEIIMMKKILRGCEV